jgi:hypothetical protein
MADQLQCTLQAIDAANGRDPTDEAGQPTEFLDGRRMSEALAAFAPDATEPLRIATRGQYVERWLSPRRAFPEGKAGYFAWRNAAKKRHAERLSQIMAACGYDEAVIARVAALARKEQLRSDAEAQTLEDVACLVFLRYYAENFAAKHQSEKVFDILVKTQRKMSPRGRTRFRLPRADSRTLQGGAAGARSCADPLTVVGGLGERLKRRIGLRLEIAIGARIDERR